MNWRVVEVFGGLAPYCLDAMACEAERRDARRYRREPPVSRMGNKAGFVPNVLKAFGLTRARWSAVWMNDLDPVCHLFHMLYASSELRDLVTRRLWAMVPCPECLSLEVNAALDGQLKPTPEFCGKRPTRAGCMLCSGTGVMDARQLWERIRKEPVPGDLVEACAAGLYMQSRNFNNAAVSLDVKGQWQASRETSMSTCTFLPESRPSSFGPCNPRDMLASRVSSLPSGMASLADLTAQALFMQSRSFQLKPVSIAGGAWDEKGYKKEVDDLPRALTSHAAGDDSPRWTVAERVAVLPGKWVESGYAPEINDRHADGKTSKQVPRDYLACAVSLLPGPGGCNIGISRMDALDFVRGLELGKEDVLVLDPPYEGTSGYQASSCRDAVLEIARIGHEAGALVLLHEACPLANELGTGWEARPAGVLRARASTFWGGDGEREWLTFNRKPVWWPAIQQGLFT